MQMKLPAVCCLVVVTFCLLDSALAHPPHRRGGSRGSEDSDVDHPRGPGFRGHRSEEDTTGEPEDVTGKPFRFAWRHGRHHVRRTKPEDATGKPWKYVTLRDPTLRPPFYVLPPIYMPYDPRLRGERRLDGLFRRGPHGRT